MIRDPVSFQIQLDTIARFVREKLILREREVTKADGILTDNLEEIEAEQALVAANRELIACFEKKILATLARVWGDEVKQAKEAETVERAA